MEDASGDRISSQADTPPTLTFTKAVSVSELGLAPASGTSSSVSLRDRRGLGSGTLRIDNGSISPGSLTPIRMGGLDPNAISSLTPNRSPDASRKGGLTMDVSMLETPGMGNSEDFDTEASDVAHAHFFSDTSSSGSISACTSPLHVRSFTFEPPAIPMVDAPQKAQARFRGWVPTEAGKEVERQLVADETVAQHPLPTSSDFWSAPVLGAPRGFALETALPAAMRLLTYNVLAMRYVKTDKYPHCPPWSFADDYRANSIAKEVWGSGAHVIALQELSTDMYLKPGLLGDQLRAHSDAENVFHLDRNIMMGQSPQTQRRTTQRSHPLSLDLGDIHTVESCGNYNNEDDDGEWELNDCAGQEINRTSSGKDHSFPWYPFRQYRSVFIPVTDRDGSNVRHSLDDWSGFNSEQPSTTMKSSASRRAGGWGNATSTSETGVTSVPATFSPQTPPPPVSSDEAMRTSRGDIEGVAIFYDEKRFIPILETPEIPNSFWHEVSVQLSEANLVGVTVEYQTTAQKSPTHFLALRQNANLLLDRTPVAGDKTKLLLKSHNVAILLPLWCLETQSVVLFVTTHLYWDSHKPEMQILFMSTILAVAAAVERTVATTSSSFNRTNSSQQPQSESPPTAFQGSPALAALHLRRRSPESTLSGEEPSFSIRSPMKARSPSFQLILLGDLNSTCTSATMRYLLGGRIEFNPESTSWKSAMSETALELIRARCNTQPYTLTSQHAESPSATQTVTSGVKVDSPFKFSLALAEYLQCFPRHVTAVNPSKGFSGSIIDHILISTNGNDARDHWFPLACGRLKRAGCMPSRRTPSDHIPVSTIIIPSHCLGGKVNVSSSTHTIPPSTSIRAEDGPETSEDDDEHIRRILLNQ